VALGSKKKRKGGEMTPLRSKKNGERLLFGGKTAKGIFLLSQRKKKKEGRGRPHVPGSQGGGGAPHDGVPPN